MHRAASSRRPVPGRTTTSQAFTPARTGAGRIRRSTGSSLPRPWGAARSIKEKGNLPAAAASRPGNASEAFAQPAEGGQGGFVGIPDLAVHLMSTLAMESNLKFPVLVSLTTSRAHSALAPKPSTKSPKPISIPIFSPDSWHAAMGDQAVIDRRWFASAIRQADLERLTCRGDQHPSQS